MITDQHKKAILRRKSGVARVSQLRRVAVNPKRGGVMGYSLSQRLQCISLHDANLPLSLGYNVPSKRSIRRWKHRVLHLHPTGNKANVKLRGVNMFLLYIYRLVFPRCTADEVRRFLFENSPVPLLFSRKDITVGEQRLGFTRKRASIIARQALREHNLIRRRLFWTSEPPFGIVGVPIADLIDVDEMGINLQATNRPVGKSLRGSRVEDEGAYGHDVKYTLIMAIGANNFKHISFRQIAGSLSVFVKNATVCFVNSSSLC